jgi:hypothetical protein
MKKLKAVVLSDLHLGEPEGILWHKDELNVIDILATKIETLSKGTNTLEDGVEELILIGDIVDLSEAKDEEAYENTKVVLEKIIEKVEVDKIVYIPGNHDHHLWVELLKEEQGEDDFDKCNPKIKIDESLKKKKFFLSRCLPKWPPENLDIRYPNYKIETEKSFFLFDHGHLFSKTIENMTGAEEAESLDDLEELTYKFMELIWYETKSKPREFMYDLLRKLGLEFRKSVKGNTFMEDSTPLMDDFVRSKIKWYLRDIYGIKDEVRKDFHFVFGHSHNGGRLLRADRKIRFNGRFISLWNTGGWLVPSKVYSPDAYIFSIENSPEGMKPDMYKLVSMEKPEDEGDYPKKILRKRALSIG